MGEPEFHDFLTSISDCFVKRDFEGWRNRIVFPFSLITSAGPVFVRNEQEAHENFELYLQASDAMRLDCIYRTAISLENCNDGTWIGTYETNMLSNGVRATAPYTSSAMLVAVDGIFKMRSILNARGHHDWTGKQPDTYH